MLLERNGFLGGTMTSTSLGGVCGLYSLIDGAPVRLRDGLSLNAGTAVISVAVE